MNFFTEKLTLIRFRVEDVNVADQHTAGHLQVRESRLLCLFSYDGFGEFLEVCFYPESARKAVLLRTNSVFLAQRLRLAAPEVAPILRALEAASGVRLDVFWYTGDVGRPTENGGRGFMVQEAAEYSFNLPLCEWLTPALAEAALKKKGAF